MMDHVISLRCLICGKKYGVDEIDYVCPDHGAEGIVDVQYDYDLIRQRLRKQDLASSREYTICSGGKDGGGGS